MKSVLATASLPPKRPSSKSPFRGMEHPGDGRTGCAGGTLQFDAYTLPVFGTCPPASNWPKSKAPRRQTARRQNAGSPARGNQTHDARQKAGNASGAGVAGMAWRGNAVGPQAQGEYEASARRVAPRFVLLPDGKRLAVLNGGGADEAVIDLWTIGGPVLPGETQPAAPPAEEEPSPGEARRSEEFRTWTSATATSRSSRETGEG